MKWTEVLSELGQNADAALSTDLLELIHRTDRIFLVGAGRSGLALKAFAMRLAQLNKTAFVVGETTTPAIQASDLLIIASSSGETTQLVQMAATANNVQAHIWLWSTHAESTLGRSADTLTLLAGKSKFTSENTTTIQPMGSLFEQSVWLYGDLFTANYMSYYGLTEDQMKHRHANLE